MRYKCHINIQINNFLNNFYFLKKNNNNLKKILKLFKFKTTKYK